MFANGEPVSVFHLLSDSLLQFLPLHVCLKFAKIFIYWLKHVPSSLEISWICSFVLKSESLALKYLSCIKIV